MKTVDKKEILDTHTPEYIQQAEAGKFHKLIPDTFIVKMENNTQGYAIRHLNRKDMILIDTVGMGAQKAVKHLVEEGYDIKAILITHKNILESAYADMKTISEDAGRAPIYTHPMNTNGENINIKDITAKNNIFGHFSLSVRDFPAETGEASVVYSEINQGMVFSGKSAIGAAYDSDEKELKRPELKNDNKKFGLAETWRSYMWEFMYFFPNTGKPRFELSEGEQKDIVIKLGQTDYPGGGNPNL